MLFNEIVSIWLIRVISPSYYFLNVMSQNLGSVFPLSHNVTLSRSPSAPLTFDVIYGCPLTWANIVEVRRIGSQCLGLLDQFLSKHSCISIRNGPTLCK